MRKLATIRKIDEIRPILGADAIEAAVVGGWTVVIKRSEFVAGDLAVYLEIDSWVPNDLAPFLSKGSEPREFNGVKGERLRTVKLRGQVSQGLLIPISAVYGKIGSIDIQEGRDLTEFLGIQKWEAPIPAQLAGDVAGAFPSFIPKTDQERIQNLSAEFDIWRAKAFTWEVSEKLDGSSMTVYFKDGKFGVCSRNWELKETEGNTLWSVARKYNLEELLSKGSRNLALQGELVGEGIQGNPYKLKGQDFFIFDIYDIDKKEYMKPTNRRAFVKSRGLKHVPVFKAEHVIRESMEQLLKDAEGKSVLGDITGPEREGLVFKCNEFEPSFKAISNKFLLKGGN